MQVPDLLMDKFSDIHLFGTFSVKKQKFTKNLPGTPPPTEALFYSIS